MHLYQSERDMIKCIKMSYVCNVSIKIRESRILSSFLSLVKVFSSNGLVKISANCSLVLLGTCSQMLRIKNKATQKMLSVKVLRPP
jgi:hypothetical protein